MSNEERKQERQEKVKAFLKKNKFLLQVLGVGVVTVIGGTILVITGKRYKILKKDAYKEIIDTLQTEIELPVKSVDEDVFTMLAPAIEGAVLDKGLEKVILDRSYDLGDNLHKLVTVSIENVYGD
jgi:RNase H-fold protein (predicted Holliday junction resolvase)